MQAVFLATICTCMAGCQRRRLGHCCLQAVQRALCQRLHCNIESGHKRGGGGGGGSTGVQQEGCDDVPESIHHRAQNGLLTRCRCAACKVAASARASLPGGLCHGGGDGADIAGVCRVSVPGQPIGCGCQLPKPPAFAPVLPAKLSEAGSCGRQSASAAMPPADCRDQEMKDRLFVPLAK